MKSEKRPAPGRAFKKPNDKWTFYVYPEGVAVEAPEYVDEESAIRDSHKTLLIWEANDQTYGDKAALVGQRPIVSAANPCNSILPFN